jgi:hypothetical protein
MGQQNTGYDRQLLTRPQNRSQNINPFMCGGLPSQPTQTAITSNIDMPSYNLSSPCMRDETSLVGAPSMRHPPSLGLHSTPAACPWQWCSHRTPLRHELLLVAGFT